MRQEQAYRRGTVAGLSLGEVFILLSFVLVLAVLLISIDFRRESGLGFVGTSDAKSIVPPDPELIQTLSANLGAALEELNQERILVSRLEDLLRKQETELESVVEQMNSANEDVRQLQDEMSALGEENREAKRLEIELASARTKIEDLRKTLARKNAELASVIGQRNSANEYVRQLQDEVSALWEENREAKRLEIELASARTETLVLRRALARQNAELENVVEQRNSANEDVRQLQDEMSALGEENREAKRLEIELASARTETLVLRRALARQNSELESAIEQMNSANEDVRQLQDEMNVLGEGDREAKRLETELASARSEIENLQKALALAEERVAERVSKNEKGSNPPCWYVQVPAGGGQGTREKAIYALDLLVTDKQIQFGNRGLPSGIAEGNESRGRSFAEEAKMLGLQNMPYGVWLTHAQAGSELRKLADAGNAGEVRTYPCKFFAKVWDQTGTGPESKENWRRIRENVIERSVLIYLVKDDPWPH